MTVATFQIQGSAIEPYQVIFNKIETQLKVVCSCPAGVNHQFCKHITAILTELPPEAISEEGRTAGDVRSWLLGSQLHAALEALKRAEAAYEVAKSSFSKAKRHTSAAMHGGKP